MDPKKNFIQGRPFLASRAQGFQIEQDRQNVGDRLGLRGWLVVRATAEGSLVSRRDVQVLALFAGQHLA